MPKISLMCLKSPFFFESGSTVMRTSKREASVCHAFLEWGTYRIQKEEEDGSRSRGQGMPKTQEKNSNHLRAKQLRGAGLLVLHTRVAVPRMFPLHLRSGPTGCPTTCLFTSRLHPHSPATSGI